MIPSRPSRCSERHEASDHGHAAGHNGLEPSIAPRLLKADRAPKHRPGTYTPPYPSFSARFGEEVEAVVMAYFDVQGCTTIICIAYWDDPAVFEA